MSNRDRQRSMMEKGAENITRWIGSTTSVLLHSILFIVSFVLPYLGVVTFERMLLFLTTIVSLEAIYLSIFIQMSLNMNNQNIEIIQEDIEELGEDIEEIQKDVEEIHEDVEEIQKDVEEIHEDVGEIQEDVEEIQKDVDEIHEDVGEIQEDVVEMQVELHDDIKDEEAQEKSDTQLLLTIQATLLQLQKEIEQLKSSK